MISKRISSALRTRMAAVPLEWPPKNLLDQPEMFVKKVVFDLHGPILDWSTAFCAVAKSVLGVDVDPKAAKFYHMDYDANIGISPKQFQSLFPIFARMARGGYGDLEAREGIRETFEAIHAAGIKTEIWTWVPGAAEYTPGNLRAYGTGIAQSTTRDLVARLGLLKDVQRDLRFVKPDQKVPFMAEEHLPLIVEDHVGTAVAAGSVFGLAAILTPETHNEHLVSQGVLRLRDHAEIAPTVIDFFAKLEAAGALLGGKR